MNNLLIDNEFSQLDMVILGSGHKFGGCPNISDTYDPKSKESIRNNNYPLELNITKELNEVVSVLKKFNVNILRPKDLPNCNQIFVRDVGFVIGDKFFLSNMIFDRQDELQGISDIVNNFSNAIINIPKDVYVEGGDVVVSKDYIFVGYSNKLDFKNHKVSRTSENAIKFLSSKISYKKIIGFELIKSDDDPYNNCLHLDCCFQPLGLGHVIVCPEAFKNSEDIKLIESIFGKNNVINITLFEMYSMFSNIFSVSSNIIISEINFTRLNNILFQKGYKVQLVNFSEISKMGGLLRCATLPMIRR